MIKNTPDNEALQNSFIPLHRLLPKESALVNDFLFAENRILRSHLGKRIKFVDAEREELVRHGIPVKKWLSEICSIVRPETILKWHRQMKKNKWTYDTTPKKSGRPKITVETESNIITMARENRHWGYKRICGELKKIGCVASETTVRNILKKHGLPPSPKRKSLSWKTFIKAHSPVAWAADFFTEEIWTTTGMVTCYVLFFIHIGSRRVYIAGCTPNPRSTWVAQQARNFTMFLDDAELQCKKLVHDRDPCFTSMDKVLESANVDIVKTPSHTPVCNAFAERFVREARETLDNLVIFGIPFFRHVLRNIEKHHNEMKCDRIRESGI